MRSWLEVALKWLEIALVVINVGIGVGLAVKFQTWNPVITGLILAAMCWVIARLIRRVITGR